MKIAFKIIITILTISFCLFWIVSLSVNYFFCKEELTNTLVSEFDSSIKAELYRKDCGATSSWNYILYLKTNTLQKYIQVISNNNIFASTEMVNSYSAEPTDIKFIESDTLTFNINNSENEIQKYNIYFNAEDLSISRSYNFYRGEIK